LLVQKVKIFEGQYFPSFVDFERSALESHLQYQFFGLLLILFIIYFILFYFIIMSFFFKKNILKYPIVREGVSLTTKGE